ncbi:MAG: sulfite exporter TauE/SafE family protein [Clostridia bacterium]|nr:sulfite exporter TauE/SafE family protein [Clostridia bacterium]
MLILTGMVSGIISGMGMGGGTILIIILTNIFKVEQHIAQANNLIFFIPTSIAAIYVHSKNKNMDKKIVMKMLPTGIIGAMIGASISAKMEGENLKKFFGIFLLCIGVYEIVITVKNKKR